MSISDNDQWHGEHKIEGYGNNWVVGSFRQNRPEVFS